MAHPRTKKERFVETGKGLKIEPPPDKREGGTSDSPFGKQHLLQGLAALGWRVLNTARRPASS